MANSKSIIVKESEQELKKLLRQQPIHKKKQNSNVIGFEENSNVIK